MPITKLTEEYLPAFIYITDLILADEATIDYKKIAEEGVAAKKEIDARTIKRAFDLREELAKNRLERKIYKPTLKTLNVLCAYYFENPEEKFLKIAKGYREKIEEHYTKNSPTTAVIQDIFKAKPEKIQFLEQQQDQYIQLKNNVEQQPLSNLVATMEQKILQRFEDLQQKMNDDLAIKTKMIAHMEIKIDELQQKLKQAHFMHNTLGALGLFFVSIDYDIMDTGSIFEAFLDDYDGTHEDLLEDLI
ncbi:hypothetical protein [Flavivirga spongiicola]|uniref:Uncharacterized protein n=1 Tax=Flavivirga spongiicola TaxID=421621 RepID=A0ABU7XUZ1_9FLAO|nr:hypothetical protein [Flavivirga sp. MEBiC05379]MDO5979250.1 hypothetical protein [Flavivirga sp. MEBiC05379]